MWRYALCVHTRIYVGIERANNKCSVRQERMCDTGIVVNLGDLDVGGIQV